MPPVLILMRPEQQHTFLRVWLVLVQGGYTPHPGCDPEARVMRVCSYCRGATGGFALLGRMKCPWNFPVSIFRGWLAVRN